MKNKIVVFLSFFLIFIIKVIKDDYLKTIGFVTRISHLYATILSLFFIFLVGLLCFKIIKTNKFYIKTFIFMYLIFGIIAFLLFFIKNELSIQIVEKIKYFLESPILLAICMLFDTYLDKKKAQ